MPTVVPRSADEVASELAAAAARGDCVNVHGSNSKARMAGPIRPSATVLRTTGLSRILRYEPNDLTVSVEAGMPFAHLQARLRAHGQMIALDPPFAASATVGGVVAANTNGPLRCGFGAVRDLVIGMTFATLEGKLVSTGGMVVKNVAGLDMGKLLIGSFGTLAVLTSVNFRLHPRPAGTRTFVREYADIEAASAGREAIAAGPLQPLSLDLLSPAAAARFDLRGHALAVLAGGSPAVLVRYGKELPGFQALPAEAEPAFWQQIRSFTPDFLQRQPAGVVLRISTPLSELPKLWKHISGPAVARAASGVTEVHLPAWSAVEPLTRAAAANHWPARVDFAPDEVREREELWPVPGTPSRQNAFVMMEKIKNMFDPGHLLNRSRLYGRL